MSLSRSPRSRTSSPSRGRRAAEGPGGAAPAASPAGPTRASPVSRVANQDAAQRDLLGATRLPQLQACRDLFQRQVARRNVHHQVERLVVGDVGPRAVEVQKHRCRQPRQALVAVDRGMTAGHRMRQRGRLQRKGRRGVLAEGPRPGRATALSSRPTSRTGPAPIKRTSPSRSSSSRYASSFNRRRAAPTPHPSVRPADRSAPRLGPDDRFADIAPALPGG